MDEELVKCEVCGSTDWGVIDEGFYIYIQCKNCLNKLIVDGGIMEVEDEEEDTDTQ